MTTLDRLIKPLLRITAILGLLILIAFLLAVLLSIIIAVKETYDERKRISSTDQENRE